MNASGDDQPNRKRWRLVPIPVLTGVLAVIGAVVLAVFLSGCRGPSRGPGPTASSGSAAPSTGPTYRVTATVPVGKSPQGVAVDPGTHTVYVANRADGTVSVIDASTRTVTATVPVGSRPNGVAVDPGTHTVYVTNTGDNTVSVIDASTRTVTATVPVGKNPTGVAVDPGTHTVYVANRADDTVSVIDASTRTVTATVPVGSRPYGVAVDPGTHTVYVTNTGDNTVSVIDASTRTVTATVPVGKNPTGVAVDPGTHTVYVTNTGDNTVSVIDASTRTVTATVPVGKGAFGVAVDPGTHTVYVAVGDANGVGDRRLDAHRHHYRARRRQPGRCGRGGSGSGHPHRLRHPHRLPHHRRRHGVGDRISIVVFIAVWARRVGCRSYISGGMPTLSSRRSLSINHCRASQFAPGTSQAGLLGQRIVLYSKDRGCTKPGCAAPAYHSQVHHVRGWASTRRTDINELTLVEGVRLLADTHQLDPCTAPLVKQAYVDILAGASLNDICRQWNSAGALTVTGRPWIASALTKFLRKPRNAGLRTYGGRRYGPVDRDAVVGKGTWPALVDESTFWAAQSVLDAPGRAPGRKAVRRHLLTSVALCGKCGHTLAGSYRTDGRIVYVCKQCHGVSILADNVEPLVYRIVSGRLAMPDAVDLLKAERHDTAEAEALRTERAALLTELDNIGLERGECLLTGKQAKIATDRINEKLAAIEARQQDQERLRVFDGIPLGKPKVADAIAALSPDRFRAVLDVLATVTVAPVGKGGKVFNPERVQVNWK